MDPPLKKRRGPYGKKKIADHIPEEIIERVSQTEDPNDDVINYLSTKTEQIDRRSSVNIEKSGPRYKDNEQSRNLNKSREDDEFIQDETNSEFIQDKTNIFDENDFIQLPDDELDNMDEFVDAETDDVLSDFDLPDENEVPLNRICNDMEFGDLDSKYLFPGSSATVGEFMLLLAIFVTKHGITGDGIQQLLNIISFALPEEHKLCTSFYNFKQYFKKLSNPLEKHFYCRHCLCCVSDDLVVCPNKSCNKSLTDKEYFLEIPLINQLKTFFSQPGFYQNLQGRFTRSRLGDYQDIYDGKLYNHLFKDQGPLSNPDNISFCFNTDGAPVFKSSKISIWPIFLTINELPYKVRVKTENMLLAGLWFGNQKPSMSTFLKPLLIAFKQLQEGVEFSSPDRGTFEMKSFLIAGTADLPARALVCNSVQYNGTYSCWKCLQSGKSAKRGKGSTMVFPFSRENPKGPERTVESIINDARQAVNNQKDNKTKFAVNGIKGPSWLILFPEFNIQHGVAIDYMHGVLLGVQKLLIKLWFTQEFSGKPYNYYKHVCQVDERLLGIQPTTDITRLPRGIAKDLKYWKASEFCSFLLYFGPAVIHGIVDYERFNHYLLLVHAIHLLLKYGSTEAEIDKAEQMIFNFCKFFANFYDQCFMTLNVHQLLHLADGVRYLGPLFTHSCFPYEDKNGFVLKTIKGTQNIDTQIITEVSFVQKMPELKYKCIKKGSVAERICTQIEQPNILKRTEKIAKDIFVLGAINTKKVSKKEHELLCHYLGNNNLSDKLPCFTRMEHKGQLLYGIEYARMIKRDNSTIRYMLPNSDLE